jgi:hypothetical protein
MNDIEKEILFKSIEDFPKFFEDANKRNNLKLKNKIDIRFIEEQNGDIVISINTKEYKVKNYLFKNIIDEFRTEKMNLDKNEIKHQNKLAEENLRNVIFNISDLASKVHKEYIEDMLYASEIASAHNIYLKKVEDLSKVLDKGNALFIEELEIKTKDELQYFLNKKGFKFA